MKEQLDNLRLQLDGLVELTKEVKTYSMIEGKSSIPSLPLIRAIDSLLLAKGWAGQLAGELGIPSPYLNDGKRKDVKDIEPTDAKININNVTFGRVGDTLRMVEAGTTKQDTSITYIEKVDWLRQQIATQSEVIKAFDMTDDGKVKPNREANISRSLVWTKLKEARMHLGFELGRLRDESF